MVVEIFSQPRLGPLACVAWRRVVLPDVGSSSRQRHEPDQHNLPQALDVDLCGDSEAMWENAGRNVSIASDHPKHHDQDWLFGFLRVHQYNNFFVDSPSNPGRNFSSLREYLSVFKSFRLFFYGLDKNWPFLVLFGWVLWLINHCRLFNVKSCLYIYIKYIGFGLVEFYGISTIVGYLMPNPL